jgi:hypothetical protein
VGAKKERREQRGSVSNTRKRTEMGKREIKKDTEREWGKNKEGNKEGLGGSRRRVRAQQIIE